MQTNDYEPLLSKEVIVGYLRENAGTGKEIYHGLGGPRLPTCVEVIERLKELERERKIQADGEYWWPVRRWSVSRKCRRPG